MPRTQGITIAHARIRDTVQITAPTRGIGIGLAVGGTAAGNPSMGAEIGEPSAAMRAHIRSSTDITTDNRARRVRATREVHRQELVRPATGRTKPCLVVDWATAERERVVRLGRFALAHAPRFR